MKSLCKCKVNVAKKELLLFAIGQKKTEVSEVFDAKRAPLFVLVTICATETQL